MSKTEVAVIVTVPRETPLTIPLASTVARNSFKLLQVTDSSAPPTAVTFSVNEIVDPTFTVSINGVIVTSRTSGATSTLIVELPISVLSNTGGGCNDN